RPHSQGREARGPTGAGSDQVRAGDQSQDCEGAGPRHPHNRARPRRRGDRVMWRREFITLLGGAAAWPLAARAQQVAKLPTIGFLGADASNWSLWTAAFVARLRELGWSEGRTIAIEYRWSEGRAQNAAEIAAEFVRLRAAVIVTNYSGAFAAKQATSVIPIIFVL